MNDMTKIKLWLFVLAVICSTPGCLPGTMSPIVKDVAITITAGGAVYSLDDYCTKFPLEDRRKLRATVNSTSAHKAVITCAGDPIETEIETGDN